MLLSYNQIIQASRNFQTAHYQLKNFGNGLLSDEVLHNQIATFKYPLMWMEDLSFPVENGTEAFGFRVSFVMQIPTLKDRDEDLMSTNENEAVSDMIRCAKDFLSYWRQNRDYDLTTVDKNAPIQTLRDVTPDRLFGAYIDIRFVQPFDYNACVIPMNAVTPPADSCAPVFIYIDDVFVENAPSGSAYYFTSGGGGSFTYDLYLNGVDTGQDVLVDGSAITINVV